MLHILYVYIYRYTFTCVYDIYIHVYGWYGHYLHIIMCLYTFNLNSSLIFQFTNYHNKITETFSAASSKLSLHGRHYL